MNTLNDPSLFRKGGLIVPGGAREVNAEFGKNLDGSWYVSIGGQRAIFAPRQMFGLAVGILERLGYKIDLPPPDGPEGIWRGGHHGAK